MKKKEVNKHIKMYATDDYLELIKDKAKLEGETYSNYLFSLAKKDLKRNKK
jgi:hypothetical protein